MRRLHTKLDSLTPREREVLTLIGHGLSLPEIASRLHRSQKTVESHRLALGRKLRVGNQVELARIAITAGLAPLDGNGEEEQEHRLHDLREEVTRHQPAWRAMRAIDAALSTRTGHRYLRTLAPRLCEALGVRGAILTEFLGRTPRRYCRVLGSSNGQALEWDRMPLPGTPCERVAQEGFGRFEREALGSFPEAPLLRETGAESYMGVRLQGARTEPIGVLGLLHDGPFDDQCQPELILRICAARAAAELERARMEEKLLQLSEHLDRRVQQRTVQLQEVNQQLRQSERKFRTLVETMNDGLAVINADGLLTYVNHRFCELLGRPSEQLIGRSPTEFFAEPNDIAWFTARDFERRQGTHQPYELQFLHADDHVVTVRVSPRSLFDDDGRYTGSFAVFSPIDEL